VRARPPTHPHIHTYTRTHIHAHKHASAHARTTYAYVARILKLYTYFRTTLLQFLQNQEAIFNFPPYAHVTHVYLCVCVCVCVCVYLCMYKYILKYMYICIYIYKYAFIYIYICVYIIYIHVYIHIFTRIYVHGSLAYTADFCFQNEHSPRYIHPTVCHHVWMKPRRNQVIVRPVLNSFLCPLNILTRRKVRGWFALVVNTNISKLVSHAATIPIPGKYIALRLALVFT